ncbi:3-hydroxyacyl-CoA dehydrogenase [Corynebacterium uberis]|nr:MULTISPECIES: 3-hydroxyacyl-CoA dehydrogenase [Corynebacterium]MCZ9309487.1 3-hydroxyacyl-CoA dehydrogenase [Corynebacterium sp. c6VSa_13]UDL73037.1 3-hydroxyacyl-CoA dehydrogenase [Corynebacterium uberis]UDL76086.1 3-hydroxyacyl-CoA dehydrogenase [Corynebacterium uberis]UDL78298.1 3-hydroxyacyl-CoA dehydrogenase [Corynebacterium uberis]UDL80581.1 3-hydroxyacyl-CoA dehydrogenase [Corynebacterium uberis]
MSDMPNLTVFGTGVLGSQIILQAAYHGKNVVAFDVAQELLDRLPARWEALRKDYRRDLADYSDEAFDAAVARITPSLDPAEALKDADVVIEAVPERLDLKRQVWETIGANAPEKTIFATNTSSLKLSDIADASGSPERFCALHFANRVWQFNIGEVMGHAGTDPAVVQRLYAFAEEMGLEPVLVKKETPGFILNRLNIPLLNAGVDLYMEGVASIEDIDRTWRVSTGAPRGPFETYDIIGFRPVYDIRVAKNPEDGFAKILKERMDAGKSGIVDGEGFYRYDEDGNNLGIAEFAAEPTPEA